MNAFQERRERALAGFRGGSAIVAGAVQTRRNGDSDFAFRQESDFYYLTGFDEPDAILVLAPEHPEHRTILFLRERDRAREIWDGWRLGVERAVSELGVDAAYPIDEFDSRIPEYLVGAHTLWYDIADDEARDRRIVTAVQSAASLARRKSIAPHSIVRAANVLHPMRAIKSADELATMRRAAEITGLGHVAGMRLTRPGAFEYEIQAAVEFEYRRSGARHEAYESIVAGGDNATILHYTANRAPLLDGTLVLVDSGCEFDYHASDVTRTWPVNGRFSAEQRAIYEIVLRAQAAAMDEVRPGRPQNAFHQAAVRTIVEGLIDVKLLRGSVDENLETERYRDFYMHGTGHWLGLDVHDAGSYRDEDGKPISLQPGMVTTVEPGIYVHRDVDCDESFKGIGVRIEDDLAVTADGHENLTLAIPKAIDDLEALVGEALRSAVY